MANEFLQRKEYADYPTGHAIILHDKLPNIKDDFFGDGHELGGGDGGEFQEGLVVDVDGDVVVGGGHGGG